MKYFVFSVQTTTAGDTAVLPTATFDTIDKAESSFHSLLASAMAGDTLSAFTVLVIDMLGNVIFKRAWTKTTN